MTNRPETGQPADPTLARLELVLEPCVSHELHRDELGMFHTGDLQRLQPSMTDRTARDVLNLLHVRREANETDSPIRMFRRATGMVAITRGGNVTASLVEWRYHGQIEADDQAFAYRYDQPVYQATARRIRDKTTWGTAVNPAAMASYTYIPHLGHDSASFYSRLPEAQSVQTAFGYPGLRISRNMTTQEAVGAIARAAYEYRTRAVADIMQWPHDPTQGVVLPSDNVE